MAAKHITIPVSIYSAWVMLGFRGCWALWETFQLLRREGGGFQARRFTKQDDYVRNRLWRSQRGKVTHKHTHRSGIHVLCCGFLIILCLQIKELSLSCFKCCKRQEIKMCFSALDSNKKHIYPIMHMFWGHKDILSWMPSFKEKFLIKKCEHSYFKSALSLSAFFNRFKVLSKWSKIMCLYFKASSPSNHSCLEQIK